MNVTGFGGGGEENRILYDQESWEVAELEIKAKFRKPNPGMLTLAIHLYSAEEVLMVGDREEDRLATSNAQIPFLQAKEWIWQL